MAFTPQAINTEAKLNGSVSGLTANIGDVKTSDMANKVAGQYTGVGNQYMAQPTSGIDVGKLSTQEDQVRQAIKPGESYMTPGMKVADRAAQIIDDNSPLMEIERNKAAVAINRSGLLSTSAGQGAIEGQVLNRAVDMAKMDTENAVKFGLQQQSAENKVTGIQAESVASGVLNEQQQEIGKADAAFKANMQGLDRGTQIRLEGAKAEWSNKINTIKMDLDAALQMKLKNTELDMATAQAVRDQAGTMIQNHQVAVENLLGNPDFLAMKPESVANILNQLATGLSGSVRYVNDTAGIGNQMAPYVGNLTNAFHFNYVDTTVTPNE